MVSISAHHFSHEMKEEGLTPAQRERYEIVRSCIDKEITNAVAATRLCLTIQQVQRMKRAVEKYGEAGVVHGNRSNVPWNATPTGIKKAIVAFLKKKKHCDFGPTFAMDQLKKQTQITLSRETVRSIMEDNGLWKSQKRAGPAIHREWRERKAMYGEMIQFDGSYHRWFENGEEHCLLASVDDATGKIQRAVFDDSESVAAIFRFWWAYIESHGLPAAVYLDKFSTYKINHKAAVDNEELMTQFRRAMTDLGIRVINANSPEAKGRIERLFGTLQDRLIKEMRLEGIKDRKAANRFLEATYISDHNERFSVQPRQTGDGHRPHLDDEQRKRLPSTFSVQSKRTVTNDFTFRFKNQWYQLSAQQSIAVYRGDMVVIEERLDETIHIRLNDIYLAFTPIAKLERPRRPRVTALTKQKPAWKPPIDHPWRRAQASAAAKELRNAR